MKPMMTDGEWEYLEQFLFRDMTVLEWGTGYSTIKIAEKVNKVVSIEYNSGWYEHMRPKLQSNVDLCMICPNIESKDDGTREEYFDYVTKPFTYGYSYGLVIIDGRARAACAEESARHVNNDTVVLIHDFTVPPMETRESYLDVFKWFEEVGHVEHLVALKKMLKV